MSVDIRLGLNESKTSNIGLDCDGPRLLSQIESNVQSGENRKRPVKVG